jgi:hypothetical protein
MDVVPTKETRMAHTYLLDKLRQVSWMQWGPFDHADLHYHVTLANRGLTRGNFTEVWSFINQQEVPHIDLYFDNLALLKIDGSAHSVYKVYRLLDGALAKKI